MLSLLLFIWLLLLLLVPTNSWEVHLFFFFHLYMTLKLFYDWSCWRLNGGGMDSISPLSELQMHQREITWPLKMASSVQPSLTHLLWCLGQSGPPSCYHALKTGHEPLMKTAPLQRIISQLYLSVIVFEWISWQQGAKWTTGIAKRF